MPVIFMEELNITITDIDHSQRALPDSSSSHFTNRLLTNSRLNSTASSSRLTLPMASLPARRRPNSSNRLDSKVLVDLTVSQVVPALFLDMVVWAASLRRRRREGRRG